MDYENLRNLNDYGLARDLYHQAYPAALNAQPLLPDPYNSYKHSMPSMFQQQSASTMLPSHGLPLLAPLLNQPQYMPDQIQHQNYNAHMSAAYAEHQLQQQQQQQREQQREQKQAAEPKEDKPVGGVSATLDYEMDDMTSFVAEMTVGVYALYLSRICMADIDITKSIRPGAVVHSTFRKWVSGVLNATRLPSATILLSLSYLSLRVRHVKSQASLNPSERSLYQMLTVSLILGSKFLDDNTFQNKSWAEVSNISVAELNREERDWLISFNHRLHHDPHSQEGFSAWEEQWNTYLAKRIDIAAPVAKRPFDTDLRRLTSSAKSKQHVPAYPIDTCVPDPYAAHSFTPFDPWHSHRSSGERSPCSSTYTGPNTPEYYGSHGAWAPLNQYATRLPYYGYQMQGHAASYAGGYTQQNYPQTAPTSWNCHGPACQCGNCRQTHFAPQRYAPIVAG